MSLLIVSTERRDCIANEKGTWRRTPLNLKAFRGKCLGRIRRAGWDVILAAQQPHYTFFFSFHVGTRVYAEVRSRYICIVCSMYTRKMCTHLYAHTGCPERLKWSYIHRSITGLLSAVILSGHAYCVLFSLVEGARSRHWASRHVDSTYHVSVTSNCLEIGISGDF